MPENLAAEMPKVDDSIPSKLPDESPEDYKKRLVAASHSEPVDPHDEMLRSQAEGTYRDEDESKDSTEELDDDAA
ncbi:MAG: hypothetical protein Q8P56_05660 [Candidatus Uhrbacteria bacterium]|nr:hypothetical protein [Candidatus Uhrbacteria bacterium]